MYQIQKLGTKEAMEHGISVVVPFSILTKGKVPSRSAIQYYCFFCVPYGSIFVI